MERVVGKSAGSEVHGASGVNQKLSAAAADS